MQSNGRLDLFRLEILASALDSVTEEIEITLLRSAYSQVVKEAQDASCAIFTAAGRIVAQPVVIPGHLGSMKFMLESTLETFPADSLQTHPHPHHLKPYAPTRDDRRAPCGCPAMGKIRSVGPPLFCGMPGRLV